MVWKIRNHLLQIPGDGTLAHQEGLPSQKNAYMSSCSSCMVGNGAHHHHRLAPQRLLQWPLLGESISIPTSVRVRGISAQLPIPLPSFKTDTDHQAWAGCGAFLQESVPSRPELLPPWEHLETWALGVILLTGLAGRLPMPGLGVQWGLGSTCAFLLGLWAFRRCSAPVRLWALGLYQHSR